MRTQLDVVTETTPSEKTKHPGSPSFIFKSDPRTEDEEFAKRLIEKFEEWKAEKYGPPEETEEEEPVYEIIQVANFSKHVNFGEKLKKITQKRVTLKDFFKMDFERQNKCSFEPEMSLGEFLYLPKEVQKSVKITESGITMVTYSDLQDQRRRLNWFIRWAKKTPRSNDAWHKAIAELGPKLAEMENGEETLSILIKELRKRMKFAPGPISGTIFKNPDGSKYETAGISMTTAKKAFKDRHGLEEEFVSVDRVQLEGQRTSKIVVGQRKTSDRTLSHYYDLQPEFMERTVNGETKKIYRPREDSFLIFTEDKTLPKNNQGDEEGYLLTIREYEQALIAGAKIMDEIEEFKQWEEDDDITQVEETGDDRELWVNEGMDKAHKTIDSISEEEQEIHQILINFEEIEAAEFMLIPKKGVEAEMAIEEMNAFFRSTTTLLTENAIDILQWTARNRKDLLPFMKEIIIGRKGGTEKIKQIPLEYLSRLRIEELEDHFYMMNTNTGKKWKHLDWKEF